MSRVTSLEGLHLTNSTNDFKFYHGKGKLNNGLLTEYQRLANHLLETLTADCELFFENSNEFKIVVLNIQSLKAHKEDLINDVIIMKANLLILTETWFKHCTDIIIGGYNIVAKTSRNTSSSGVGIYMRDEEIAAEKLVHKSLIICTNQTRNVGDLCGITLIGKHKEIDVFGIYVDNGTNLETIKEFMLISLHEYRQDINGNRCKKPMLIGGDFNLNLKIVENVKFLEFVVNKWGLTLQNDIHESTTLKNSTIDLILSRETRCTLKLYITYFSYHKAILMKIFQLDE